MTAMKNYDELIATLAQGASISRERNMNLDFAKVADEAATAIQELQADRDEWKDSTLAANQNAASEEARRRVMQLERDELRDELDRCKLHVKHIGNDALGAENRLLNQDYSAKCTELEFIHKAADDMAASHKVERDALMAEIERMRAACDKFSESELLASGAAPQPAQPLTDDTTRCPFCGSNQWGRSVYKNSQVIVCSNCFARGPQADDADAAKEAWTGRVAPAKQPMPFVQWSKEAEMIESWTAPQAQPLTDEEIETLAHRTATKYTHRSDPTSHSYGFVRHTLIDFARKILEAQGEQQ
jgi:hypothetical protein